jgi:poly(3-hydroxybutyrate) depolymerase
MNTPFHEEVRARQHVQAIGRGATVPGLEATMRTSLLALFWLAACAPASSGDADGDGDSDDGDNGGDDGGDDGLQPAPLAELSGGCPDLTASGTSTFESSGSEREVTVVVPENPDGALGVVFFFHGLMDPTQTPHPADYMADALDLQGVADDTNTIIVLPVSNIQEMFGFRFFMWDAAREAEDDLVLYDDLRTCTAQQHDVDLKRLTAFGFSGGALFTTVIMGDRGDTLAAAIEASGGSDVVVPLFDNPFSVWVEPAYKMPVLLQSGGATDVWPDTSLTLVDFTAASNTLEGQLVDADHTVIRCEHDEGHTLTWAGYNSAIEWATMHVYGEPSPWHDAGVGDWDDWCRAGQAAE